MILQNQSALAEELQHVTEMQKTLEEACCICVQSRGYCIKINLLFYIYSKTVTVFRGYKDFIIESYNYVCEIT